MTLLLFVFGGSTIASSGSTAAVNPGGLFAVSGGTVEDKFQVTSVSYTFAPTSRRTE